MDEWNGFLMYMFELTEMAREVGLEWEYCVLYFGRSDGRVGRVGLICGVDDERSLEEYVAAEDGLESLCFHFQTVAHVFSGKCDDCFDGCFLYTWVAKILNRFPFLGSSLLKCRGYPLLGG